MLLHWSTLTPTGPSNLAAVRFASPVRVHSIRVFPTNATPFHLDEGIIARTEPSAFLLDVFFNAQPTSTNAKNKQKPPNALIPTSIAYTGGQAEFPVNMGDNVATRLMIIKGNFESISIAVYGDLFTEDSSTKSTYEPGPLPSTGCFPLSRILDPANSTNPTLLARQLLQLIPDSPPLPLVVRLMFCLKPPQEDWERPGFPYLYADLGQDCAHFTLEDAYDWTKKPVDDECDLDLLEHFAKRVADCAELSDSSRSCLLADILCNAASQRPDLSRLLMKALDVPSLFDASSLDKRTIVRLLDAASNIDIAQALRHDRCMEILHNFRTVAVNSETRSDIHRLLARVAGWQVLEDALSNTQANFIEAATMLKDVGLEEMSFGILVGSMISHCGLATTLAENPMLPIPQPPPLLLGPCPGSVSHDNFIAFVRAFIGVSCVLAVYAWADSVPHDGCRERTLGVLRLWQNADGYREIVNHLLLLRQMVFRLECMTQDNDPPTQSGVHAEQIVLGLASEPHSFLRKDFTKCILGLQQPLLRIDKKEQLSLCKMALLSQDGIKGALEELTSPINYPLDMQAVKALRLSLAIVEKELEEESNVLKVLKSLWQDRMHGLVLRLIDLLAGVRTELAPNFSLTPPSMGHELVQQLFNLAEEILRVIARLALASSFTSRSIRTLIIAVADIFVYTDAADMSYAQENIVRIAANGARIGCIDLVCVLAHPPPKWDQAATGSITLLKTLLEHASSPNGGDLVTHLLQVFCLVDHVLPQHSTREEQLRWSTFVLPGALPEITTFFRCLDTENKVHLVKRLVKLDAGLFGIGEWLVLQELRDLSSILQFLDDPTIETNHRDLGRYQVLISLHFLIDLLSSPSDVSAWVIAAIETVPDISDNLASCFVSFLEAQLSSPYFGQLARALAEMCGTLPSRLHFVIVAALYHDARDHVSLHTSLSLALSLLKKSPVDAPDADLVRRSLGDALFAASETPLTEEIAVAVLATLQWWSERPDSKIAVSATALEQLCCNLSEVLDSSDREKLASAKSKIITTIDKCPVTPVGLPTSVSLSLNDISDLLRPPFAIPSTPIQKAKDEVFNMVAISPPTAFLRSPAVTGLTKTYLNNDFRELRSLPSARQNTSRLPSKHVDDFEHSASSPTLNPLSSPEAFQSMSPLLSTFPT